MICEYGCGKKANYIFKNGKGCCEDNHAKCPNIKKIVSKANKGKIVSDETKDKISTFHKGRVFSDETRNKMSISRCGHKDSRKTRKKKSLARIGKKNPMYGKPHPNRITCKDINKKYPFFSKIEEVRQNGSKVQVRCKLKSCRKWFTPTHEKLRYRIYALEHPEGNDGLFFYCSESCKNLCPSYNVKPPRNLVETELSYTYNQYKTFRQVVLERDNYKCQYCEELATIVHHERPQKLEPLFVLDPDFAWSCCEECHYKYGHKTGTECSTGKLAAKIC